MRIARQFRHIATVLVVLSCFTLLNAQAPTAPAAKAAPAIDSKKVMSEARAAYYSLSSLGFNGVRCAVVPNWKTVLGDNVDPAEMDAQVKRLNHLKFGVIVN